QLLARLASGNIYFRETAQRILTERLGNPSGDLRGKLEKLVLASAVADGTRKARLHALWALVGSGSLEPSFHGQLLRHADPAYRAWGVRAAGNFGHALPALREKIAELAVEPSPDVQLQVAVASRKIKGIDALAVLLDVLLSCRQD